MTDPVVIVVSPADADLAALGLRVLAKYLGANGAMRAEVYRCGLLADRIEAAEPARALAASIPIAEQSPTGTWSDGVEVLSAATVARLLGVSARRVGMLAERLGGRKVEGRWLFDAAAVREFDQHRRNAK